jgi:NADH dehydrogenase (ubiquinone) 1 alpha subcomplex subunit 9
MLYDDTTASQTFELYGPKEYSTAEIAELVDREIYKKRRHINVPKAVLRPTLGLLNKVLWWPIGSADEVEREFHDQAIDETAKTFKDLGIEPGDISKFTYNYLVRIITHWNPRSTRTADSPIARIPKLCILRSPARN